MLYNNLRWWEFEIESKSYKKEELGPKFKGKIRFVYNYDSLEIYDILHIIDKCVFSLRVTEKWNKSSKKYSDRENFLKKLIKSDKNQKAREFSGNYTKDDLLELDAEEIRILNENSFHLFQETKTIYTFVFGINAPGELSNPKGAPIIMTEEQETFGKNFAIFFKYYSVKNKNRDKTKLERFVSENPELKNDYFQEFKNRENKYLTEIIDDLNNVKCKKEDDQKCQKRKIDYLKVLSAKLPTQPTIENKVIKKRAEVQGIAWNKINIFKLSEENELEKAHIFPVKNIKELLIQEVKSMENKEKSLDDWKGKTLENLLESENCKKILEWITDPNNLIALEPTIHRKFDAGHFTWSDSGEIQIFKSMDDFQNLQYNLFNKIRQIDPNDLSDKRKEFLNKRQNLST